MVTVPADTEIEAASSWEDRREVAGPDSAAQAVMIAGNTDWPSYLDERAASDSGAEDGGVALQQLRRPGGDGGDGGRAGSCASRLERRSRPWWWGAAARRRL